MTKRMWVCKVTSVQSVDIVCSENIWKFASALRWHGKFINLCSVHTVIRWHADLAVTVIYNSFNFFPFLFCFHSLLVLRDWFFFSPSFIFSVSPFVSLSHCINQILESVSHIHQHDIVHRDLKVSHAVVMETCAESRARHQMTPIPLEPPSLGNWVAWHVRTQDCNAKRHFTALENNSSGLFPAPLFFSSFHQLCFVWAPQSLDIRVWLTGITWPTTIAGKKHQCTRDRFTVYGSS